MPRPSTGAAKVSTVVIVGDFGSVKGGQAKVAIESALQLKARGIHVCFVAGSGPLDERLIASGVEVHLLGDHDILSDPNRIRAATRGVWNAPAALRLAECIAAHDPRSTAVHVHGWAKALSPSIGPVVTRSACAHVYTLHEYFLACPNGGFYDYSSNEICHRRALGLDCLLTNCDSRSRSHKMWRTVRHTVLRSVSRMPSELSEIIYLATEQRAVMSPYLSKNARWHYLPNAVGPRARKRVRTELNNMYLFVGRLSAEKGAELVAKAASEAGVHIAFAGEGQRSEAVRRNNGQAQMLGWVPSEAIGNWMKRARCLVFPSVWYETYGLVVAEALRAGLPVIVSSSSVAASLVRDGIDGIHVKPGDVNAWAAAMRRLGSNSLVRRMSEAAFEAGGKLLGEDDYISRLLHIYDLAIERKNSTGDNQDFGSTVASDFQARETMR